MRISARNQLVGTIENIEVGAVTAIIRIKLDGSDQVVTSSITKASTEELGLKKGDKVSAVIKSSDVMVAVN